MMATDLVKIPVWQGNRTMDKEHANKIRDAIGSAVELLDSGYRIVNYDEQDTNGHLVRQSYLIDGQHRQHVLKEHFLGQLCEPDFPVLVQEKDVESEGDAIAYFNAINNVKPQRWRTDPALLVNQYIAELEKRFNTKASKCIRQGTTCRPYLSVERLRETLKAHAAKLEQEPAKIQLFVQKVADLNRSLVISTPLESVFVNGKDEPKWLKTAVTNEFMLAVDPKMKWVADVLR
jgi:hypothetical protein